MSGVCAYQLRPSRINKRKAPEAEPVPIPAEETSQYEDVRCVICMEPPHNAVLLLCSSYYLGCRAYMCDTSARHSNCFKEYRRNNKSRLSTKNLKCPLCRGEFSEAMKVTSARRFMNAKPRSCSVDDCEFTGTYSQLENHSKAEHPRCIRQKVDPLQRRMWERMVRDAEIDELFDAAGIPRRPRVVDPLPVIQLTYERVVLNAVRTTPIRGGSQVDYAAALMPRMMFRETNTIRRWTP